MSDKSELEYLEEAMSGMAYANLNDIRRAIERRKQDLAKADAALLYTNREKLYMDTPQNVPNTADNTPKGGGDDLSKRLRNWMTTPFGIHETAELCDEAASALDALLAERDALSAHDSQCIKDRVSFCEEIEELEAVVERLTAERDAARAEILELHEKVSFLESREVCAAAHDNVETCGYCQRDAARAELKEAVQLLRTVNKSYWQSPEGGPALLNAIENLGPFLTRVGKQP